MMNKVEAGRVRMIAVAALCLMVLSSGTGAEDLGPSGRTNKETTIMRITVGKSVFFAEMCDNDAAKALLKMLPLTLTMSELNGREKFHQFSQDLPVARAEKPDTIRAGEIMCWSSNSFVLFYATFPNSYGGYIRLGKIADVSGLSESLGRGSVKVTFSRE